MLQTWYSTHDVARLTGVTPMTVIRWFDAGQLRGYKTAGGHRRVERATLEAFLRARGLPPPESGVRAVVLTEAQIATACTVLRDQLGIVKWTPEQVREMRATIDAMTPL